MRIKLDESWPSPGATASALFNFGAPPHATKEQWQGEAVLTDQVFRRG